MFKVNYHSITENTYNIRVKYSRWKKIKNEFPFISDYSVTGVITALITDNNISLLS
jgi:hypothetical protein